ncbi:MAG: hypothetical protein JETT_0811 [Candidatus Jettenia ecosi]|uniref:Uncharacterized protein n=1 Tax=Candidatus Jettenia ecosi TaxID=2494326 RepID=A0A533QJJ6_9BACT|nr:MAG: hypothetical protein JETT_0811 [Candidatus Jettenia ecosi]
MSAMIISSLERLIGMAQKLENFGITTIHFYSAKNSGDLDVATIAFVPFVDFVILGKDAPCSLSLNRIIKEAQTRRIPVLSEECIEAGRDKGSLV